MSEEEISYRFRDYSVGVDTSRYTGHTCMIIIENQTLDKKEVLAMQFYDEQAKAIQNIINQLLKENKKLKERIDKAIEYIKEHTYINDDCDYGFEKSFTAQDEELDKLLKILEGGK